MTKWVCKNDLTTYEIRRLKCAPSFAPAWAKCDNVGLMEVTISEPVRDCFSGDYLGREFFDYYPRDFLMPGECSYGPNQALTWGENFYSEGLSYTSNDMLEVRNGCFRSAELLYLHAALSDDYSSSSRAWKNLGYVYEYDRTNGNLWPLWMGEIPDTYHEVLQIKDRKKRAYRCYEISMLSGDVEAIYKFGDMKRKGLGCKIDTKQAFELYMKAWKKSDSQPPYIFGSIASRLANCYEKGIGCKRSLEQAKEFYERAIVGLEITQNDTSLYENVLSNCKKGIKRIYQEIDLNK